MLEKMLMIHIKVNCHVRKMFEFTSVSEWKNWRRKMHSKFLVSDQKIKFYKEARLIFRNYYRQVNAGCILIVL